MRKHNTHVPVGTQIDQMVKSLKPLAQAGVLRKSGPRESLDRVRTMGKLGISLASLVETSAGSFPNRTAIIDDSGALTFTEMRDQGRALARSLRTLQAGDGGEVESIALITRNSHHMLLAMIAGSYLGVQIQILNPASSLSQLRDISVEYPSNVTFVDAEFTEVIEQLDVDNLVVAAEWSGPDSDRTTVTELIKRGSGELRHVALPRRPKQKPTVIMSSGTRGVPKAVVLPVPRTPKVLGGILEKIPFRSGDVLQLSVSMFHAWGWLNLQIAVANGSTLITHRWIDADREIDDVVKYQVTGIISAAVYLRQMLETVKRESLDTSSVRFIVSAGNAIPPELVIELNKYFGSGDPVVHNFYGSTEHGQISIATAKDMAEDPTTAGQPGPGVRLAILSEDGEPLPPGRTGVIFSSNSMTSMGFLSDKDSSHVVDGMLSTGDKGHIDHNGRLYIGGRADDMVIRGGENIYPRVIEEFLYTLPEVDDVYVMGEQSDLMAKLTAYVVPNSDIDRDEINAKIVNAVSDFAALDHIVCMEELPRNDAGKVVPRHLPDPTDEKATDVSQ
ncbi:AMP-binding protein [Corynebacterium sp. UBA2622]|uniref:AMP-binding protein n=1 Tax=Corynebacterium sp. UBA2622 TaxID=1946393 RepID=UPI0032E3949F